MEAKTNQALYRRYRSTSFDELVGQEHVTELLKAAVKNGAFSHAYLFTGQRGTGKTSAARILAYAINGLPYEAGANHLDIIEIDAASNRRIDDIRDLREKVFIAPVSAKYKVYIIDEVHMLTGESFNALLKTLEEPPAHAIFILATTELHKVPATIISRVQRFHFRPVALTKVVEHLKKIAEQEHIAITDDALRLVAEHGGGSFRDSISLLDQLGSLEGEITEEIVETLLGRARSTDMQQLVTLLEKRDQDGLHVALDAMLASGNSPVTLAEQLVATLLKLPTKSQSWYELAEKLMGVSKAHFPTLLLTSTLMGFVAPQEKDVRPQMLDVGKDKYQDAAERVTSGGAAPTFRKISQDFSEEGADLTAGPATSELRSEAEGGVYDASGDKQKSVNEEAVLEGVEGKRTEKSSLKNSAFDWTQVLAAIKKTNPALHAVLMRAKSEFADNTLTLTFAYALHRKKLEQNQYQTQLRRAIQELFGIHPELRIQDTTSQIAAHDDTAKNVADLMGGGERVRV